MKKVNGGVQNSARTAVFRSNFFEQSYEDFMKTIAKDNDKKLMSFLKMDEDTTNEEVESVINYLKLRKVKRMLL